MLSDPPSPLRPATSPRPRTARARSAAIGDFGTAEILRLSWPVMLSAGFLNIAGLVDRAMIGRLGGDGGGAVALAAVGFVTQLFFLIQSTQFAIGLACLALMARAIGAGDPRRSRASLAASIQVAIGVTVAFAAIMLSIGRPALAFLGAEPTVVATAMPYLFLIIGSTPAMGITLTLNSALRADRDTSTPMRIALAATLVKLFANWVLIFGNMGAPRLGLVGAGVATVIAQVTGVGLFLAVMLRKRPDSPLALEWRGVFARNELRREVVRIALPGIAERVVMNLALLSYFWVLSRFYGTVAVAVYTVGVALLSFSWIPGMGYASACATLVAQALGARKAAVATGVGWRSAALALVTAFVLGAVCVFARDWLARLLTTDVRVIAGLGPFMLALAVAQPFLQLHFTLAGAHRGAGDTWTPLVAATVGNWAFRVPLACVFAWYLETSVLWVWYVLIFDHVARAIYLTWEFRRGKWKTALTEPI